MRRAGRGADPLRALIDHVWDFAFEGDSNVVDVYVRYLREKIDRPFGRETLETVRGVGYRLRAEGDADAAADRLRLTLAFAVGMAVVLAVPRHVPLRPARRTSCSPRSTSGSGRGRRSSQAAVADGSFTDRTTGLSDPDEAFSQVLDRSGADPRVLARGRRRIPSSGPSISGLRGPVFVNRAVAGQEDPARLLIVPVDGGRFVVVGATLSDRGEALDQLLALFAIGGPVALLLISLAGWAIAGAALRPVERMRVEAAAISASEPERRLPVPAGDDEIVRLATTLNEMLGRLQESLARERRFVDDAAHELRTPLAILNGELELALSRPRTAARARGDDPAGVGGVRPARPARRGPPRARARAGGPAARPPRGRLARRGGGRGVRRATGERVGRRRHDHDRRRRSACERRPGSGASGGGEPARQRHPPLPSRRRVRVANGGGDGRVWVRVEDDGPGFGPEVLPIAFEPFSGASSNGDGAGLGLAIARAVAAAHGGDATAENLPGRGARVTITLRT